MDDSTAGVEYTLSRTLTTADSEPVRCLAIASNDGTAGTVELLVGGQNGVLSVFSLQSLTNECETMTPHTGTSPHAMTSVLDLPSTRHYAVGCKDSHVRVYDKHDHSLVRTLSGHEKSVTSLSWLTVAGVGYLASGSWDGSARIWNVDTGVCVATMADHENTVTVLGYHDGGDGAVGLVTASAGMAENGAIVNHKIRMWRVTMNNNSNNQLLNCEMVHTPRDNHTGPIRGLASMVSPTNGKTLVSCSNDSTVKVRSGETGECVQTLTTMGNSPIILDVTAFTTDTHSHVIAAAAEDGHLLIWTGGTSSNTNNSNDIQHQSVPHPACVWKTFPLPNGDIVTACQDGQVRIFTTEPTRFASPQDIAAYAQSAQLAHQKTRSGPSPEEIANLPKWELRSVHTGKSEGQVQVFARDARAIAAQWNDASRTWVEVGEVMGSNPNAGDIDGTRYDHVLPIEVDIPDGGLQKLKIGYNNGENPFVTAQKFIDDHMLDQNYLSQIADYIRQRVGDQGVNIGGEAAASSSSMTMDMAAPAPPTKQQKIYNHLPMKGYMSFEVPDMAKSLPKIMNKIRDLQGSITTTTTTVVDITPLDTLQSTLAATSRYHSSTIEINELKVLQQLLTQWPIDALFPVLDLVRITVLHPDAAKRERSGLWKEIVQKTLDRCAEVMQGGGSDELVKSNKLVAAVPMLGLRVFTNCFRGERGSMEAVLSHMDGILKCAANFSNFSQTNKNLRLTVATLILNTASSLNKNKESSSSQQVTQILTVLKFITSPNSGYESEAVTRALVALGTILFVDGSMAVAKQTNVTAWLGNVGSAGGELSAKGSAVVEEIYSILE